MRFFGLHLRAGGAPRPIVLAATGRLRDLQAACGGVGTAAYGAGVDRCLALLGLTGEAAGMSTRQKEALVARPAEVTGGSYTEANRLVRAVHDPYVASTVASTAAFATSMRLCGCDILDARKFPAFALDDIEPNALVQMWRALREPDDAPTGAVGRRTLRDKWDAIVPPTHRRAFFVYAAVLFPPGDMRRLLPLNPPGPP